MIFRVFVEKKEGFDVRVRKLEREIKDALGIDCNLRFLNRYDYEGDKEDFEKSLDVVFSEPPADNYYLEDFEYSGRLLCTECLPGQYDQRADSAAQCVSMLTLKDRPAIRCASVYVIDGVTDSEFTKIKQHLINPVESRECGSEKYAELEPQVEQPEKEEQVDGFTAMSQQDLQCFYQKNGFAFTFADLQFIQKFFAGEGRNPFFAELKLLDTYWSDHCRHTTFNTHLEDIKIESEIAEIKEAYNNYKSLFEKHHAGKKDKYPSLMDMATIGARELRSTGELKNLYECGEVNACSIVTQADCDGKKEDWVVMFKNETHNHPTEIDPYGGAATCLGGAIRDPLSGGTYVYQAMRVSGAADIFAPLSQTRKGKLPQRTICKESAAGFSSYGNQIGLATGLVTEIYHSGYEAKRLETGFVVGAAPLANLRRRQPKAGDIVLIVGGKTGRDGCGGATGSSKAHDTESAGVCGAEVQKGNAPMERKIQRLFRNAEFSRRVVRCNDFGAGGVCVAIGELADSIDVNLDLVPTKYAGLSGTELAISESQERMAVIIDKSDLAAVLDICDRENVDAASVAEVTDTGRLRMFFNGQTIVDLPRAFLDANGVKQTANAIVTDTPAGQYFDNINNKFKADFDKGNLIRLLKNKLSAPNDALQKGLSEMFDSTVGSATVLMPFGGKNQLSPSISMAAKLPTDCVTGTATVAAFGFDPYLSEISPFIGAYYAVVTSVIKAAVSGADIDKIYLTFQEYFERLGSDPEKWGKPTSALLGALSAQLALGRAAIGGKDSMSGSFEDIHVPPTLISFALGIASAKNVVGSAAKSHGTRVFRFRLRRGKNSLPDIAQLKEFIKEYQIQLRERSIEFATVAESSGAAVALLKSLVGGGLGFEFLDSDQSLFTPAHGDVIFGIPAGKSAPKLESLCEMMGQTTTDTADSVVTIGGEKTPIEQLTKPFADTFQGIYPITVPQTGNVQPCDYKNGQLISRKVRIAKPRVFIPVFPGTNCEYDSAKSFAKAGAEVDVFVVKNRSADDLRQSVEEIKNRLDKANILMLPGGFSGGDEPDGSGKFICALLTSPYITEAVHNLLYKRDGLALGICNGFQALIKLGLLPYGRIQPRQSDSPTLSFNTIDRHISQIVRVRVASNLSPWLAAVKPGQIFNQPVSHGEGRFIANEKHIKALTAAGQIAMQYADLCGQPTMQPPFNPNGSINAIEGITSPDGRIFGKMSHSERVCSNLYKNMDDIPFDLMLFESGVKYFD